MSATISPQSSALPSYAQTPPFRITQICPSIDRACGVGNFSRNLAVELSSLGVAIQTATELPSSNGELLLVQHEFALYDNPELKRALRSHPGLKVLFAHSPGTDVFSDEVDAFVSLCEGMVRSNKPRLVLPHPGWQQLPLSERVALKQEFGWSKYRCVVGTNGFLSPTRQYDLLLEQLADFAALHDVLVLILCPRHDSHDRRPGLQKQEDRLLRTASQYPDNVRLEMQFLDQAALNRRLQACDLLWCWTAAPSKPYGSGTCSDQYGSGTRLIVSEKRQHGHVFDLPNVVIAPPEIDEFVDVIKAEVLKGDYPRHDPGVLSWASFANRLADFCRELPRLKSASVRSPSLSRIEKTPAKPLTHKSNGRPISRQRLSIENAAAHTATILESIKPYDPKFSGRGIVICAGGVQFATCAWVLIRLLRKLGCSLPIEVWCYEYERDSTWEALVAPYDAVIRTLPDPGAKLPPRWRGWRLKPAAVLHSSFREVLLIDADNVPVRDPAFLFSRSEYLKTGAVFWPDKTRTPETSDQWRVFGVPFRDEPQQESGQVLINKERSWRALNLCGWYNSQAPFFYRYVYGDKDTFRFAWHRTDTSFAMPSSPPVAQPRLLLQHDFNGKVLFQHRFKEKWNLFGNRSVSGFQHEDACLAYISELRAKWRQPQRPVGPNSRPGLDKLVRDRRFCCVRPGHSSWRVCLDASGMISEGWMPEVKVWWTTNDQLVLGSAQGRPTFRLSLRPDGTWVGGAAADGVRIVLTPLNEPGASKS